MHGVFIVIVGIDIETTGLEWNKNSVLSIGIAYRRPTEIGGLSVREFRCCPRHDRREIDPEALRVNKLKEEEFKWWADPEYVADKVRNYLFNIQGKYGHVVLVSYKVEFDKSFLERSPWIIKEGWWGPCVKEWVTDLNGEPLHFSEAIDKYLDQKRRLELEDQGGSYHNADYDALGVLLLCERLNEMDEEERLVLRESIVGRIGLGGR